MLETSSVAILVLSCLLSFGLGRLVVSWRKRRKERLERHQAPATARSQADESPALNKSKRRRQQRQGRGSGGR